MKTIALFLLKAREKALKEEIRYRIEERLAILCGDQEPTPEQLAIAQAEAYEWAATYEPTDHP
jgi:hypothetical protein